MAMSSDLAALANVRRFVQEVGLEAGLNDERIYDLKVALSEACANAVEHAGGKSGELTVCSWRYPDRLVLQVSSPGDFRAPASIDAGRRQHRGMGLPLMVALTDEVSISRPPTGGTVVTLTMLL